MLTGCGIASPRVGWREEDTPGVALYPEFARPA